jgi:hypothetical protein
VFSVWHTFCSQLCVGDWITPGFSSWSTILYHQLPRQRRITVTRDDDVNMSKSSASAMPQQHDINDGDSISTLICIDTESEGLQNVNYEHMRQLRCYAMRGNVHKRVNNILNNVIMVLSIDPTCTILPTLWTTSLIKNNRGYEWIRYDGCPTLDFGDGTFSACRYRQ